MIKQKKIIIKIEQLELTILCTTLLVLIRRIIDVYLISFLLIYSLNFMLNDSAAVSNQSGTSLFILVHYM